MPIFYHIHIGVDNPHFEKFEKNRPLYFSRKNSRWYRNWKSVGEDYGGHLEYKISFPRTLYTTSFNPRSKNKIVKITKENIKEYKNLKKKYRGVKFIEEMNKRNIIGIDCTPKWTFKHNSLLISVMEGYFWKKVKEIKIEKV